MERDKSVETEEARAARLKLASSIAGVDLDVLFAIQRSSLGSRVSNDKLPEKESPPAR